MAGNCELRCLTGQVHGAEFGRDFLRHESLSGVFRHGRGRGERAGEDS